VETVECRRLDDYTTILSNLFGETLSSNVGYIDADVVGVVPPVVTNMPGKSGYDCFTFDEVGTDPVESCDEAERLLVSNLDDYISSKVSHRKLCQEAALIWRIKPEINRLIDAWMDANGDFVDPGPHKVLYQGYSRLMVLTKDSKRGRYY